MNESYICHFIFPLVVYHLFSLLLPFFIISQSVMFVPLSSSSQRSPQFSKKQKHSAGEVLALYIVLNTDDCLLKTLKISAGEVLARTI